MKTALFLICSLIVFENKATDPGLNKKILIIGFSNSYFNSNSFESISMSNDTHEDSIFKLINHKVLETFTRQLNPNFEYEFVENARNLSSEVSNSIYYLLPSTERGFTSIKINNDDIIRICESHNADIVVFINSYEVNWEEEPYLAYVHKFDTEMFISSGERIDEESVSFMTDDVKLTGRYASKLSKQVSRILRKLERVSVVNDAFVIE